MTMKAFRERKGEEITAMAGREGRGRGRGRRKGKRRRRNKKKHNKSNRRAFL